MYSNGTNKIVLSLSLDADTSLFCSWSLSETKGVIQNNMFKLETYFP